MFLSNSAYDPDTQKYLDYHKELLKRSEQAQLVREALQAHRHRSWASRGMDWLGHLLLHLHLRKQAPLIPQSSRGQL